MKIAIQGCTHGDLDLIYKLLDYIEKTEESKIDLLICCGDFQAVRNQDDLKSMACPKKYLDMKDFHDYYTGRKKAPVLTLFIGGNHEAANHLWQLPYGGWVAENIYYLGYAGVVNFGGVSIAGSSGIFNSRNYNKGHFEYPPFCEDTKRSFYHTRHIDISRLKALAGKQIDICLSHDWPSNIQLYGDVEEIYKQKPELRSDPIEKYLPGNDGAEQLLHLLKPKYWFSAHHHCKFSAIVKHNDELETRFLALGKCKKNDDFLQVINIESASTTSVIGENILSYDLDWLAILKSTDHYVSKSCKEKGHEAFKNIDSNENFYLPKKKDSVLVLLSESFDITDLIVKPLSISSDNNAFDQTIDFCKRFGLTNPCDCYN